MMKKAVAAIKPKCTTNGKTSAEKYPDFSGELDSTATLVTVTSFLLGFRCLMSRFPTQEDREDPSTFNFGIIIFHNKEMIPSFVEVITFGPTVSFRE